MKKKILVIFFRACLIVGSVLICGGQVSGSESFPFRGRINRDNVKLRAGYNKNFTSLKNLKENDELIVLDRYFCWYQVKLPPDVSCYVAGEFIDEEGLVTATRLNVRAGADEKYHVLGKLEKGEAVAVIGVEGAWYKIRPPGSVSGWVNEDYLEKICEIELADIPKAVPPKGESLDLKEIREYKKLPVVKSEGMEPYTFDELDSVILAYNAFLEKYPRSEYADELKRSINSLHIRQENKHKKADVFTVDQDERGDVVSLIGTVDSLGRIYGSTATHKLNINGKTKYYLESSALNLYNYAYKKVQIQGTLKESKARYPLISVENLQVVD